MDLGTEMEFDIRIIVHLGIQEPLALREIHEVPIFIRNDIGRFKSGKILQFLFIVTGDPTCFIERKRIELN
jgi:hypothetical protein